MVEVAVRQEKHRSSIIRIDTLGESIPEIEAISRYLLAGITIPISRVVPHLHRRNGPIPHVLVILVQEFDIGLERFDGLQCFFIHCVGRRSRRHTVVFGFDPDAVFQRQIYPQINLLAASGIGMGLDRTGQSRILAVVGLIGLVVVEPEPVIGGLRRNVDHAVELGRQHPHIRSPMTFGEIGRGCGRFGIAQSEYVAADLRLLREERGDRGLGCGRSLASGCRLRHLDRIGGRIASGERAFVGGTQALPVFRSVKRDDEPLDRAEFIRQVLRRQRSGRPGARCEFTAANLHLRGISRREVDFRRSEQLLGKQNLHARSPLLGSGQALLLVEAEAAVAFADIAPLDDASDGGDPIVDLVLVRQFDVTLFRTGILVTGDQRLAALQFDVGIEIEPGFRHQIGGEFYARDVVHRRLFHRNILVFDFERIGGRVHGALGALHHHAQIIVGLFHLLGIDQPLGRREIKGVAAVFFSDIDCRLDADEIASVVLDLIGQSYRRLLPGVGIVVGIVVIACTQHGCRCEQRARQRAQSVMGRVFHNDCF